jgi:hypothetical protein
MSIKPSYGVKWSGPGGGGASSFLPLIVYSNQRGPRVACLYRPNHQQVLTSDSILGKKGSVVGLVLEQGDVFSLEVSPYTPNNGAVALIALVGTTLAVGAIPGVQQRGAMGTDKLQVRS